MNSLRSVWVTLVAFFWMASSVHGQAAPEPAISKEAQGAYEELLTQQPPNPSLTRFMEASLGEEGFDRLRSFLTARASVKEVTARELHVIALTWLRLNRPEEALTALQLATALAPADAGLWLARARLEMAASSAPEALASLDKISLETADAETVLEMVRLRRGMARQSGNDDQVMTKLREVAAARPADQALRFQLLRWEVQQGRSDSVLAKIRQQLSETKDAADRAGLREVAAEALAASSAWQEVFKLAVEGVEEAEVDSRAEGTWVGYLSAAFFAPLRTGSTLPLTPREVIAKFGNRPHVVLSMAEILRKRGEDDALIAELLDLAKKQPEEIWLRLALLDGLAEAGRHDEAVTLLQQELAARPDAEATRLRLALMLHEAGRSAEGAVILETWAAEPKASEFQVVRAAGLLPLMRTPEEMLNWLQKATARFPDSVQLQRALAIQQGKNPPVADEHQGPAAEELLARLKEVEAATAPGSQERLRSLIDLRKKFPQDASLTAALLIAMRAPERAAERWHLVLTQNAVCQTPQEVQQWWRKVFSVRSSYVELQTLPFVERRHEMGVEASFWMGFVEMQAMQGGGSALRGSLEQLHRLAPIDPNIRLYIADTLIKTGDTAEARANLHTLLNSPVSAEARLRLAEMDVTNGLTAGQRALFELAVEPALDARMAEQFGTTLMAWREWARAEAFLATQRARFPQNYRLAYLHGLALRETGAEGKAIEVFLGLSSFREEMALELVRDEWEGWSGRSFPAEAQPAGILVKWQQLSLAINGALTYRRALAATVSQVGRRRAGGALTPGDLQSAKAWGLAHLLDMARTMTPEQRGGLAERARAAGMTIPESLVVGRLEDREQAPFLTADVATLEARLDEPWAAELWFQQLRQRVPVQAMATAKLPAGDADLIKRCHRTLLPVNPEMALEVALIWWQSAARSPESLRAVAESIDQCDEGAAVAQRLVMQLHMLPIAARRDEETVSLLGQSLQRWLGKISAETPNASRWRHEGFRCLLLLGRWQDAAQQLEVGLAQAPPGATRHEAAPGELAQSADAVWLYVWRGQPLTWPPGSLFPLLADLLPPVSAGSRPANSIITEADLPAFRGAGKDLKDRRLKIFWHLAGGEEVAAKAVIAGWLKEEPKNEIVVQLAARASAHQDDLPRALDLLYGLIRAAPEGSKRLTPQTRYLIAAMLGSGTATYDSQGRLNLRPPVEAHRKRVIAVALEILPELRKVVVQPWDPWISMYQMLGLKAEAESLAPPKAQGDQPPWRWDLVEKLVEDRRAHPYRERDYVLTPQALEQGRARTPNVHAGALLRVLRQQASDRFLGQSFGGSSRDEWRGAVTKHDLTKPLMEAAEPGRRRSWLRVVQALHVADLCSNWEKMAALAEEALKLEAGDAAVELALIQARQHLGGDPAGLAEALMKMAPHEARLLLYRLLDELSTSQDLTYRLNTLDSILHLAAKAPQLVMSDKDFQGGAVSRMHRLLSDRFRSMDGEVPPLYPELSRERRGENPSKSAGSPEELARRKELFGKLCDLLLTQPLWMGAALPVLLDRHLAEDRPTAETLEKYLRDAVVSKPEALGLLFTSLQHSNDSLNGHIRLRVARLVMRALLTPGAVANLDSVSPEVLVQLIGGEFRKKESEMAMQVLWTYPNDITTGSPTHTADQVKFNQERRALFQEFCDLAIARDEWRLEVWPYWACYRLHLSQTGLLAVLKSAREMQKEQETAALAKPGAGRNPEMVISRGLYGMQPNETYLQRLIKLAANAYMMHHHVAVAELTETLLRESKADFSDPRNVEMLKQLLTLLQNGAPNEIKRASLFATTEEAERTGIDAELQERRVAIYRRLVEALGDEVEMPPEILFAQIEKALRAGQSTAKLEKLVVAAAAKQREAVSSASVRFIRQANGQWKNDNAIGKPETKSGYIGGVWDVDLRTRWFAVALRIAEQTRVESKSGRSENWANWLKLWMGELMQPNGLAVPEVPPIFGMEGGHGYLVGSTARAYAAQPALKRRDELFSKGLELAMQEPEAWDHAFLRYAEISMVQQPPRTEALTKAALTILERSPAQLADRIQSWIAWESNGKSLERRLAFTGVLEKIVAGWPKDTTQRPSLAWLREARDVIMMASGFEKLVPLPLLPGRPLTAHDRNWDMELSSPGARERHAAWLRIVESAIDVPSLTEAVFVDFARLHVEDAPERVEAAARLILETRGSLLDYDFIRMLEEEEGAASVERRLAWGRWGLRMLPHIAKTGRGEEGCRWPAKLVQYIAKAPAELSRYRPLPTPAPELLKERDELVKQFNERMMSDPELAIEGFVNYARKQFATGATPEATLEFARKALEKDPNRLSNPLRDWIDLLLTAKDTDKERLWAAKILVPLAETWPVGNSRSDVYWISQAARLFYQGQTAAFTQTTEANALLDRLMDAALKMDSAVDPTMIVYGAIRSSTPEGQQQVVDRLLAIVKATPERGTRLMENWWRSSAGAVSAGQASVAARVLRGWPEVTTGKELDWTLDVLRAIGRQVSPHHFPPNRGAKDSLAPAAPTEAAVRESAEEMVAELLRRKAAYEWLTPARLRLIGHEGSNPAERAEKLQPLLAEPLRESAVAYLKSALQIALVPAQPQDDFPEWYSDTPPPHPQAQEALDAARCVQSIVSDKLLPAETAAVLVTLAQTKLTELIALAELNLSRSTMRSGNRVLPSQGDAAKELRKEFKAPVASAAPIPAPAAAPQRVPAPAAPQVGMTGESLPAVLDQAVQSQKAIQEIGDQVWALLATDAAKAAAALRTWVHGISGLPTDAARLRALELSLNIATRWTPELPPPDWLLHPVLLPTYNLRLDPVPMAAPDPAALPSFTPQAMAEEAQYRKERDDIGRRLLAILRQFPACTSLAYFPTVAEDALKTGAMKEEKLVLLALEHLKARPAPAARAELSVVPQVGSGKLNAQFKAPVYEAKLGLEAPIFLLEHARRAQSAAWVDKEVRPAILGAYGALEAEAFDRLAELYFAKPGAFATAAQAYVKGPVEHHSSLDLSAAPWVLRVASQRKLRLTAQDWLRIIDLPERLVKDGRPPNAAANLLLAWLWHAVAIGMDKPEDELRRLLSSLLGKDFTAAGASAALEAGFVLRGDERGQRWVSRPFEDSRWACAWRVLQLAPKTPDYFAPVLQVAEELGLLDQHGCARWLILGSRPEFVPVEAAVWQRWLKSSGLLENSGLPGPLWLLPRDGFAPIWELPKVSHIAQQTGAVKWLEEQYKARPTPSRALLLLGARRTDTQNIAIAELEEVLSRCRSALIKLPRARLAQLTAALLVVQPDLTALAAQSAPDSVLRLLPQPALPPGTEKAIQYWLNLTPDKLPPVPAENAARMKSQDPLAPLVGDILKFLVAGAPQVDAVLAAAAEAFAKQEAGGGPLSNDAVAEVRERIGLALAAAARRLDFSESYTEINGHRVVASGGDDNVRTAALLVQRFLLRHAADFNAAMSGQDFEELAVKAFTAQLKAVNWDGRQFAQHLLQAVPADKPEHALLLLASLQRALKTAPYSTLTRMTLEVTAAAERDPRLQPLVWTCELAGEQSSPPQPSAAVVKGAVQLLQKEDLAASMRLVVAEYVPQALSEAEALKALQAWLRFSGAPEETQESSYWKSRISLNWASRAPAGAAAKQVALASAQSITVWFNNLKYPSYGSPGDPASVARRFIAPVLDLLKRNGEMEVRKKLFLLGMETRQVPLDVLLEELVRDPEGAVADLIPAYFAPGKDGRVLSYKEAELPVLTPESVQALKALESAPDSEVMRAARLILAACPSPSQLPNPRNPTDPRTARVAAVVKDLAGKPALETYALDSLLGIKGLPEKLLPELLPILRLHPEVRLWLQSESPGLSSTRADYVGNIRKAVALSYWALAEHFHGGNPKPWQQLTAAMKKALDSEDALYAREARDNPDRFYINPRGVRVTGAPRMASGWRAPPQEVVLAVCTQQLKSLPKASWEQLAPVLKESLPLAQDSAVAWLIRDFCAAAPPSPAITALAAAVKEVPDTRSVFYFTGTGVWEAIAKTDVPPAERWAFIGARLKAAREESPVTGRGILMEAERTGLLSPAEFGAHLTAVPLADLQQHPNVLADWLHAAGHSRQSLDLIRHLLKGPGSSLRREQWLWLAATAANQGDEELARRAMEAAPAPAKSP